MLLTGHTHTGQGRRRRGRAWVGGVGERGRDGRDQAALGDRSRSRRSRGRRGRGGQEQAAGCRPTAAASRCHSTSG